MPGKGEIRGGGEEGEELERWEGKEGGQGRGEQRRKEGIRGERRGKRDDEDEEFSDLVVVPHFLHNFIPKPSSRKEGWIPLKLSF